MKNVFVFTILLAVALTVPRLAHCKDPFFPRIVGHNSLRGVETDDGETRDIMRFYIQIKTSEQNRLYPDFRPSPGKFEVDASPVTARKQAIDEYKNLDAGASTLIMVDLSGSLVQFWDLVHDATMKFVDQMRENDEVAIAFFGGDWVTSGFRGKDDAYELKEWIQRQLPMNRTVSSKTLRQWAEARRDNGGRLPGKGLSWWQKLVNPDISRTLLYKALYEDALDMVASRDNQLKVLLVLSDMEDESNLDEHEQVKSYCEPGGGCWAEKHVREKAAKVRVPIFTIGLEKMDKKGATTNESALIAAESLSKLTRGEFEGVTTIEGIDSLLSQVRSSLDYLVVLDVDFCEAKEAGADESVVMRITYTDEDNDVDVVSNVYSVLSSEISDAPDCPEGPPPPPPPGDDESVVGPEVKAQGCCNRRKDCPKDGKKYKCEPTGEPGTKEVCNGLNLGTCLEDAVRERTCPKCKRKAPGSGRCSPVICQGADDVESCGESCKCVEEGSGDAPWVCKRDNRLCKKDKYCMSRQVCGKDEDAGACVCDLERPAEPKEGEKRSKEDRAKDNDIKNQCMLHPDKREGTRVCQSGPIKCDADYEFATEDKLHCYCVECTGKGDEYCETQVGPDFACMKWTDGEDAKSICYQREKGGVGPKEIVLGAIVLLILAFVGKVLFDKFRGGRPGSQGGPPPTPGPSRFQG